MSKNRPNPILLSYVPHGLNENIFKPLNETDPTLVDFKKQLFKGEQKDFILFFNSRNIRRKQIPDTMLAFRYFLDKLPKEKADKCAFVLHTEVISEQYKKENLLKSEILKLSGCISLTLL